MGKPMAETDIVTTPESVPAASLSVLGSQGTREFIRYFAASLIALLVDIGLLAVLTSWFFIPYLTAGALAFLCGLTVAYILSIRWVFEHRQVRSWPIEFLLFAVIGLIGLFINEVFLWLFTGILGWYVLGSKLMSVAAVFTWNFVARKYLLFR